MNDTAIIAGSYPCAVQYFEAVRASCDRLDNLVSILIHGVEAAERPKKPGAKQVHSDPTAAAALASAATMERYKRLLEDRDGLEEFIGGGLRVISGVRSGLGSKYADILEYRYIDRWSWGKIAGIVGCSEPTARNRRGLACEWIDSVGWVSAIRGTGIAESR